MSNRVGRRQSARNVPGGTAFEPSPQTAAALWAQVLTILAAESAEIRSRAVACEPDPAYRQLLGSALSEYSFDGPMPAERVIHNVVALMRRFQVHTTHPAYFGLFNPTPTFMGVLGETLAAAFNPQLAAWSHAPAAVEIESHLVRFLGHRLGFDRDKVAGSFTSGGAEANQTAVLLALTRSWPDYATDGLRGLDRQPVFYASSESHLAWMKIAHATGLGRASVRLVPVDERLRLDVRLLREAIMADRRAGLAPFLVVGTAGTTGAGAIDPLPEIADVCDELGLLMHVDAAWAGAAALSDRLRHLLDGVARATSVTVDAHKWLSVPLGAGVFICTDAEGLAKTFRVTTSYMPDEITGATDPYTSTNQWSRRFAGLKLFLSLAVAGRTGYAAQIEADVAKGTLLRDRLTADGWQVVNHAELPVVCFVDPAADRGGADASAVWHARVAESVVRSGVAWISPVRVAARPALRACITSFRTQENDIDALVAALGRARNETDGLEGTAGAGGPRRP